jgi:hypothetical protein
MAMQRASEPEGRADIERVLDEARHEYQFLSIDERTLTNYVRKILTYVVNFRLAEKVGRYFVLREPIGDVLSETPRIGRVATPDLLRPAAPPERVVFAIEEVAAGRISTAEHAKASGLRNAAMLAVMLGLLTQDRGRLSAPKATGDRRDIESSLRSVVGDVEPFKTAFSGFEFEGASSDEIGSFLADIFDLDWSPASCRRYGAAYKRWIDWMSSQRLELGLSRIG